MQTSESDRRQTGLKESRELLRDLFVPSARHYWLDFLGSAGLGYAALAALAVLPVRGAELLPIYLVAVLALYRALLFVHELTHLKGGALPGFRLVWNVLVGIPMLVPSVTYEGVHTDHHRRTIYGTSRDPEYLPYARLPRSWIVRSLVESLAVPMALVLRFGVIAPLGWMIPPLHRWLEARASSLVINVSYVRSPLTEVVRRTLYASEAATTALFATAAYLIWTERLTPRIAVAWYAVSAGIALINQVRTLAAHRFQGEGTETDVVGQLLDTVDMPGSWYSALWAPVGLRFHALHHYLPDLPYHALPTAHRRLLSVLPPDAPLRRAQAASLSQVLRDLWNHPRPSKKASPAS